MASSRSAALQAVGPRAGQKVLSLRTVAGQDEKPGKALCADAHGFSLHAAVRCTADDRQALEQLCRYITRPALANERVQKLEAKLGAAAATGIDIDAAAVDQARENARANGVAAVFLPAAAPLTGVALKNQPGHPGNFPKTPLRQFARVQALQHLMQQGLGVAVGL
jgi:hypothetical protein